MNINYAMIASAINFYNRMGYQYIEVPWFIPANMIQKAPTSNSFLLTKGQFIDSTVSLVGSAEQSFLYLAQINRLLPNVKYVAITPCFREDKRDETHQPYFMKLELFEFGFFL